MKIKKIINKINYYFAKETAKLVVAEIKSNRFDFQLLATRGVAS